jgi:hypothetical protein
METGMRLIDHHRAVLCRERSLFSLFQAWLTVERPQIPLVIGSLAIASVYCIWLLDLDFLRGDSPFWTYPIGTVPNAQNDMVSALSGYWAFLQDDWRLPLFAVHRIGVPGGTNIIFTDSIPCVALVGRLIFRATGHLVNLFGVWTALCIVLLPASLTALCFALGARSIVTGLAATAIGLSMPSFWFRWGHLSLMAHFEIVLALLLFFSTRRNMAVGRFFIRASLLLVLSLWTHSYIFLMVSGIIVATVAQRWSDRDLSLRRAASLLAGLVAVMIGGVAISGHLTGSGSLSADGFGFYSMDVLSPFIPQLSGLLPATRDRLFVGDGGQYEGYNYLGAGVLLLALLMAMVYARRGELTLAWRRTGWLLGLLAACYLVAVSTKIYVGGVEMATVAAPPGLVWLLAIVRSSGRFFWPVLYALAGVGIANCTIRRGREAAVLLLVASLLQWFDAAPLRLAMAQSSRTNPSPPLPPGPWRSAIANHRSVAVQPSFACLSVTDKWNMAAAVELQLFASQAAVDINSVYAARYREDCAAELANTPSLAPRDGELLVYLNEFPNFDRLREMARARGLPCVSSTQLLACGSAGVDIALLPEVAGNAP